MAGQIFGNFMEIVYTFLPTPSFQPVSSMHSGTLDELAQTLDKVRAFLPSAAIKNFNPNKVTARFDVEHFEGYTNLSELYDQLASSFWCDREVETLFAQTKGNYTQFSTPDLSEDLEEAARQTSTMARLIASKGPEVMDRNLVRLWATLDQMPNLDSAKEIRNWMEQNPQALAGIKKLNLGFTDVEVIPPEVLSFPNLQSVDLHGSKLGAFPHVFEAHSSFDLNNIESDGAFSFSDGFASEVKNKFSTHQLSPSSSSR